MFKCVFKLIKTFKYIGNTRCFCIKHFLKTKILLNPHSFKGRHNTHYVLKVNLNSVIGHISMYESSTLVCIKTLFVRVAFTTFDTTIRLFSGVASEVHVKRALLSKTFSAVHARVRPLTRMSPLVYSQICFLGKPFAANRTNERFFSGVCPHVCF